jgi:hypothetical protein
VVNGATRRRDAHVEGQPAQRCPTGPSVPSELARARERWHRLDQQRREAAEAIGEARKALLAAQIEDRERLGAALLAGRPDPGRSAVEKAEEAEEAAERRTWGLAEAAERAEVELVVLVRKRARGWRKELARQREAAQAALITAADQAEAAARALGELDAVAHYVGDLADGRVDQRAGAYRPSGIRVDGAVAALRERAAMPLDPEPAPLGPIKLPPDVGPEFSRAPHAPAWARVSAD